MIIKIIPETDAEKAKLKSVEHHGVKEFFMFGSEVDEDDSVLDFHDWTGSFNYLIRNLCYYLHKIEVEERDGKLSAKGNAPGKMIKYGATQMPDAPQTIQFPQPLQDASPNQLNFDLNAEEGQENQAGQAEQAEQIVKDLKLDNDCPKLKVIEFPTPENNE
jgi:hypothetical protein